MAQNSFTGRWNWTPCIGKGRSLQGSLAQETHSYTLEMSCFPWSLLLVLSPGHSFKWGVQPGISVSLLPFTCSKPAPVTYTGSKVSSWPSAHEMVLKTNIKWNGRLLTLKNLEHKFYFNAGVMKRVRVLIIRQNSAWNFSLNTFHKQEIQA